tara:strand:+ start:275 stop:1453 length:1179 start_codon:yes stop_codon:yes gene_type:complete
MKLLLIIFSLFSLAVCQETQLRKELFENYDGGSRPVIDYDDSVKVNFTLKINSLEYFDQISEKIKFNMEMTYVWYDEYLRWNRSEYDIKFVNIGSEPIWKPDLELYNSASSPELWSMEGSTKVYSDGKVRWVLPILYSFSCPLKLQDFPFDEQTCEMDFGSWKSNKDYLDIRINQEYQGGMEYRPLVSYDNFNHNEWKIQKVEYETEDIEYLCCPGELWTITKINIVMDRNYHKYLVVMIMTAFLTISALVVNTLSIENYRRTFILVFIPLSIIWLQLYIASKIPVIEYSTLMERFISTSFITCITCAIESGIFYCLLNNNFGIFPFKYKTFYIQNYNKNKISMIKKHIDLGNVNSYNFPKIRKIILSIDEIFKLVIVFVYMICSLNITFNS